MTNPKPNNTTDDSSLKEQDNLDITENYQLSSRAHLLAKGEPGTEEVDFIMTEINRLAQVPLNREQVYIRSMYLCSDQLCTTDWGKFTQKALEQICKLVVGCSVLPGHNKQSLPLARFCFARLEQRPEFIHSDTGEPVTWVRAWFYWLRETSGAKDLLLNIDGGIYREVSISWRYRNATCAICGKPILACPHQPGHIYNGERCYFVIDEVIDVLEGSLVYRAADANAQVAAEHSPSEESPSSKLSKTISILPKDNQPDALLVGEVTALALGWLKRQMYSVIALTEDASQQKKLAAMGARIFWGNSALLPFNSERLNLVWCRYALETSLNPYLSLKEFQRVLKPEGILLLSLQIPGKKNKKFSFSQEELAHLLPLYNFTLLKQDSRKKSNITYITIMAQKVIPEQKDE